MWGANAPLKLINVNGRSFPIRDNLHQFLLAARRNRWLHEWIWIDQICIDQHNVQERSAQVQRMSETYSEASHVIIWLGSHGSEGDEAMKAILEQSPDVRWGNVKMPKGFGGCVVRNPYWQRLWIMQEIILARELSVCCSNSRLSWHQLRTICSWGRWWCVFDAGQAALHHRLRAQDDNLACDITSHLIDALEMSRRTVCLEPLDMIYGMMAIVDPAERILVDYSASALEVYTHVLNTVLRHQGISPARHSHLLYEVLHLAVKLRLLGKNGYSTIWRLHAVRSGSRHCLCDRPLRVVVDLLYNTGRPASLENSSLYSHEMDDPDTEGPKVWLDWEYVKKLRRRIKIAEVEKRLRFYASIIEARRGLSMPSYSCTDEYSGCWFGIDYSSVDPSTSGG